MTSQNIILLGRITRVHGFEGAVTVKLEKQFSGKLPEMESIFLEIEGKKVPFFIEYSEPAGPGFIRMKFDGYNSAREVQKFTGCSILAAGKWPQNNNNGMLLKDLIGYKVVSEDIEIGKIKEIIENPGQLLLKVVTGRGESVLVPFHEDLVVQIDPQEKNITMLLPEGLTEIN